MQGKKFMSIALSSLLLASGLCALAACGGENGEDNLSSQDLPATTSVLALDAYRDKVKAGIVGSMAGVAYGYRDFNKGQKWEFASKDWIDARRLPSWKTNTVTNGYDQDDVYLAITAIEALGALGIDTASRELGIYMYNKNFEFWDGSNSDVLAGGFAPPFSGYPKQSSGYYTNAFSDGNSYQCGASFGGYLGLNMTGAGNELVQRFAEICTYGDGIYSAQYIAAMYGEAFFTDDIMQIVNAGLAAIPEDSWSAEVIRDVLKHKEDGKTAEENFNAIMLKWADYDPVTNTYRSPYQWIDWPFADHIMLDGKLCSAFTTIGLLYGNGDLEASTKITVQCANDCDSTAAATAGILAVINGWEGLESNIKNQIIDNQYFKYTRLTVDGAADKCVELVKEVVEKQGGRVVKVDGVMSLVIPESAKNATVEEYKCGKTVTKEELGEPVRYTEEEMARLRYLSEPGFETCQNDGTAGYVKGGWSTDGGSSVAIECMEQTAYSGLCNVKLSAKNGTAINLFNPTNRTLRKNTNYELSCMVQVNGNFASDLKLTVWNASGMVLRAQAVEAQSGWYKVTLVFNTGNNTQVRVGVQLTGKNDSDVVRLDDFELRLK